MRLRAAPDLGGEEYAGRATSTRAAFGDSNGWCVAILLSPSAWKLQLLVNLSVFGNERRTVSIHTALTSYESESLTCCAESCGWCFTGLVWQMPVVRQLLHCLLL